MKRMNGENGSGIKAITLAILMSMVITTPGATQDDYCVLPNALQDLLSNKYPGFQVINSSHLTKYDLTLYRQDHTTECPGLIKVDFWGNGNPT